MWFVKCMLLFLLAEKNGSTHVKGCIWYHDYWEPWSHCSESCGGGTTTRDKLSCHNHDKAGHQRKACNEICYHGNSYSGGRCMCSRWRQGRCCEQCRHIPIVNCKPGRQECGGTPDHIKCTECMNNNVFFKQTADTTCDRMCAWNNHFCWPGTCSDHLTRNCKCSGDFKLVKSTTETSCQPSKRPSLEICLTTFIGNNGEKKQSQSGTSLSACEYYEDVYGNFQIRNIEYDLITEFSITLPNVTQPAFVKEYNFGITDATLYVEKVMLSGALFEVERHNLREDKSKSTLSNTIFAANGVFPNWTIPVSTTDNYHLQNGEWLCARYESIGGGYIKGVDTSQPTHIVQEPTQYQKTNTTKSICYRFDNASPVHCKATNTCTSDPLFIEAKITRSQMVTVYFQDWFDPIPTNINLSLASSIESYQISIHETDSSSKNKVKVGLGNVFTKKVNATVTSMTLLLPDDSPRLYCIALEVKDVAENVRQARRFVLYDNSSFIETNLENPLYVKSASPNTNYTWQTHHNDVCIDWKGHFINKLYPEASPLNPIESDPNGFITGVYDQTDGVLPVYGTEHVYGIIGFTYFWGLNGGHTFEGNDVKNLSNQSFCKHFDLKDGQTYYFKIQAVDIVNNTLASNTTVRIDRSVPHIQNIWLQKGIHKRVFVNDSKELTSMNLHFEALDPHSGILNIKWAVGTTDSGVDLLTGVLSPDLLKDSMCPPEARCYCPDIGYCESSNYSIPLNNLVAVNTNLENNTRSYYFTIKATNNALLSNIEHVDILVADSSPETGTTFEDSKTALFAAIGISCVALIASVVTAAIIRRKCSNQFATSRHLRRVNPMESNNETGNTEDDNHPNENNQ